MATAELTLDQILAAVRKLPVAKRKRLLRELQPNGTAAVTGAGVEAERRRHRMTPHERKRMKQLLAKGNAGTLSDKQSTELNRLVETYEKKTLGMAQALVHSRRGTKRQGIAKRAKG